MSVPGRGEERRLSLDQLQSESGLLPLVIGRLDHAALRNRKSSALTCVLQRGKEEWASQRHRLDAQG